MHGNLPLVYEDFSLKKSFMDFTSTSGNKETTKGGPISVLALSSDKFLHTALKPY